MWEKRITWYNEFTDDSKIENNILSVSLQSKSLHREKWRGEQNMLITFTFAKRDTLKIKDIIWSRKQYIKRIFTKAYIMKSGKVNNIFITLLRNEML